MEKKTKTSHFHTFQTSIAQKINKSRLKRDRFKKKIVFQPTFFSISKGLIISKRKPAASIFLDNEEDFTVINLVIAHAQFIFIRFIRPFGCLLRRFTFYFYSFYLNMPLQSILRKSYLILIIRGPTYKTIEFLILLRF